MGNDAHTPSNSPVSRRAMIGGLAAGAGAVGLGLAAKPAAAAGSPEAQVPTINLGATTNATPLKPTLSYDTFTSWQFQPAASAQTWTTVGGTFRFTATGASEGLAAIHPQLPVGTVVHEWEVYGSTGAGSVAQLEVWTEDITTGTITLVGTATVAANQANFTATVVLDPPIEITASLALTPFIWITDSVAGSTQVRGARIGYEPALVIPPAFVPISPIPCSYNTRDTAGLTKLNPGEERTITLPVPVGISAAVIQLTVTETGAGGFVGVFPADAASWPGNSSINWSSDNQNVGGTVITAVSADGKIKLRGGGSPTHVIIDVPGYLT